MNDTQRKYRKQIARSLNPNIAPRIAPALNAMFDEFEDSESGYAHESDLISAMRECGLMDSTIKQRIMECKLAGYIAKNGDGYSLIQDPR